MVCQHPVLLGDAFDLPGCVGERFVSIGIHVDAKVWGFPAKCCTIVVSNITVTGLNVVADLVYSTKHMCFVCVEVAETQDKLNRPSLSALNLLFCFF